MSEIVPGWYPDPSGDNSRIRFWDGEHWTDQYQGWPEGLRLSGDHQSLPVAKPAYPSTGQAQQAQNRAAERSKMASAGLIIALSTLLISVCYLPAGLLGGTLAIIFAAQGFSSDRQGMAITAIFIGILQLAYVSVGFIVFYLDFIGVFSAPSWLPFIN